MSADTRRYAPATQRNRQPILDTLREVLPRDGLLLEIASGTGEHAAYIAPRLHGTLRWQPSDAQTEALAGIDAHAADSGSERILPALHLDVAATPWPVDAADAVFCANMIHIAPWQAAQGLFAGAATLLASGAPLVLYGPFRRHGTHTAPSNAAFDASLQTQDPRWGVRCLDSEVTPLAQRCGFALDRLVDMPANNLIAVFRRA